MDELALISIFVILGLFKNNLKDAIYVSIFVTVCSLVKFLNLDQYIYSTVLIVILTVSLFFINSKMVRISQITWIVYFLIYFCFSSYDAKFHSQEAWDNVMFLHHWKDLVYLCTMGLVIAGLANGDNSGYRSNNNNLHYDDRNLSLFNRFIRRIKTRIS